MSDKQIMYNNFVKDFADVLSKMVDRQEFSNMVFLCIGTDKIIGDSFGPLVGYKLRYLFKEEKNIEIIGDLDKLVCANNVEQTIKYIKENYEDPFIIAIDAAISYKSDIGRVFVSDTGINLGSSVRNNCVYAGDMSIRGVVSQNLNNSKHNLRLLQNTSLNLIMNMADITAKGIYNVINV